MLTASGQSDTLPNGFPTSAKDWEKLIENAPESVDDPDCPYDPNDPAAVEVSWKEAVGVVSGGLPALRKAQVKHRQRGQQKLPLKISTTIRFDPDVLAALKASGKGWQTRVNEVLHEYVRSIKSNT